MGDFNMNMLVGNENPSGPSKDLLNICDHVCPTRVTNTTKRLLDVILVSNPERFAICDNMQFGIIDHDLVYIVRKQKRQKPKVKLIKFQPLKNFG